MPTSPKGYSTSTLKLIISKLKYDHKQNTIDVKINKNNEIIIFLMKQIVKLNNIKTDIFQ